VRPAVEAAGLWVALSFVVIMLAGMPEWLSESANFKTPVLALPETTSAIWQLAGFGLLAIFLVDLLRAHSLRALLAGAVLCAVLWGAILGYRMVVESGYYIVQPIVLLGVVFAVALVAAVPIAIALAMAGMAYIVGTGTVELNAIPGILQTGISSFVMLSIPFFLLAGVMMDVGGMGTRLVGLVFPLVRGIRGGLLITQVFGIYLFSGVSGTKMADVAAVGSALRRPLKEAGYKPGESAAVLATAAVMGETVPPSVILIILASITALSPSVLLVAGILPALVIALCLCIAIVLRGAGGRYPPGEKGSIREFARGLPGSLPALALPAFLIVGIAGGIATPTEVAAFAAVYSIAVAMIGYNKIRGGAIWKGMVDAAVLSGMTLLVISTATLMSQMVTIDGVSDMLADWLGGLGSQAAFLMLSLGSLIVMGAVLEGLPALLVFAPLLMPIAITLGIDPVQYGLCLVVAMGIGAFLPPIGVGL
jgi:tripartite ATP-independent transporter DctM subunit